MKDVVIVAVLMSISSCFLSRSTVTTAYDYDVVGISVDENIDGGVLFGRIFDSQSKLPLVGANIGSSELGSFAVSDSTGSYELSMHPGTYQFTVVAGVRTPMTTRPTKIEKGMRVQIDFYLNAPEEVSGTKITETEI